MVMALSFHVGVNYISCMSLPRISASDREFFSALADVVFANPFSVRRAHLIKRLAPGAKLGDLTEDPEALVREVQPRLAPWLSARVTAEDRAVLEPALLYVCYNRHVPQIAAENGFDGPYVKFWLTWAQVMSPSASVK